MWEIIVAIILGIVEGLTEFAPVSSTGHMIIVDDLWLNSKELFSSPVANTFKIVIQLGSILAVVVIFKDRFINLLGLGKTSCCNWTDKSLKFNAGNCWFVTRRSVRTFV